MKPTALFLLLPVLLLGQTKSKKFQLPDGAQQHQYSSNHVLVKVKREHQFHFSGRAASAALKNLASSIKPIVSDQLQAKNKNRMAPRLSQSPVDIALFYEIGCEGRNVETFINELYATGYFEMVEPDYSAQLHYTPKDPQQAQQYYLDKIRAYEAWDITQGSEEMVIGIVDSGGDLDHPDLASQLYINTNDPVDGLDNDNDGYIDNHRGWDFMGADTLNINLNSFVGDNDPNNPNGGLGSHGSAVAGCAAAATDNSKGISGIGFRSKLLFTKHAADNQGEERGGIYRGYEGILYAASHGAKIINCSWGGSFRSQIQQDFITYVTLELGSLIVASAGNDGDDKPVYPASYEHVLSVAASDQNDAHASFTSYGKMVDIIAPGKDIFTTFFNNTFTTVDGTSFSSPITAGAAALVWTHNPTFTAVQVGEQLRVTADESVYQKNAAFYARKLGKGRLDVFNALTKSFPSIRASKPKLINANGNVAEPGQPGFLSLDFTNYLAASSSGLTITVAAAQATTATISNGTIQPGVLATNQTVNNKLNPIGMTIKSSVATNTVVDLIITFTDGEYHDYQYISFLVNPSFLDVDDNTVLTTLASNGRIGFENTSESTNGAGFVFNDNKLLFEMGLIMGTASSNIINNVRGIDGTFDQDFVITQKIKEASPGDRSFSEIFGTIKSKNSTVSIQYRSLAWKEKPYDQFVIVEYKVKNISAQALNGFHFALFADWDITDHGVGDVAQWDAVNNLGYVHPAQADDKPYAGIKILKGIAPEYFAIDNDQGTPGTPLGLYDGFTDGEKFQTISSGIGRIEAGKSTAAGNDVSHVVGAGPYNIQPDEEVTITFALLAGANFGNLQYTAAQADTAYNFMLTAAKPIVDNASVCFGSPAVLTASGANEFNWYKDFTGGEPFASGNTFTTNNLFSDTVFYISNAETRYESVRTPALVVLEANPRILSSGSGTICEGSSITLSVANADEYLWSTEASTQTIEITQAGNYSVNVKANTLGCHNDSEIFVVVVNAKPSSLFDIEGDLTAFNLINFINSSSGANRYTWNFGDGQNSADENPSHSFSVVKEYTVTLTATNAFGCTDNSSKIISVITELDEPAAFDLTVYPNPFRENLMLKSPWKKTAWQLFNAQGKFILSGNDEQGVFAEFEILLSDLANGLYLLSITDGRKTVVKKITKL